MLRIMLVDDEELSLRMLESIVDWSRFGVEVVAEARNGNEALQLFMELRPEIVLTDIKMPGLDGISLMRSIKELAPQTEVILISAYADFEYAKEALVLGGANYLLKPIDEFEIEKTLHKISDKIDSRQVAHRMAESTQRQKQIMVLHSYMRSGTGKSGAQKSAGQLGLDFSSFALMGFMLNETSMNDYIENSLQLDTQLPYLQERMLKRLGCWGESLLFGFFDASWCALISDRQIVLEDCSKDMSTFFAEELHMEIHVCFTQFASGLDALPQEFRALQQLNQYSFFIGADVVLGYGYNCEKSEFDQVALADAQKSLEVAIRQNDQVRARQILESALQDIGHGNPAELPYVYDFCYTCVRAVRAALPDEASPELRNRLSRITSQTLIGYTTLDELRLFVSDILAALHGQEVGRERYSELVEEGMEYLKKNFDRNISLEEICNTLGVSKNYFCYLFKKETGKNLWAYLTDIRLLRAKELLSTTQDKTYTIAYQVGYDNPSYFSKIFKKNIGCSPNEYRKIQ
ncbi:response regulator [Hydrogenoanaerobacterium sp.]|uniref:response regulator n=1 Tax=Hydrogenoanaerobacterium sp. TaxID=2953763 RepID=UPI00289BC250|nr:response regulator [Hydrogenoanaerobacterium sp.]